jgi:hypothetical protein
MADNETILAALAAMNHDDDSQWLDDGTPKTSAVQRLADDQTITRRDIEAAAPGFRRLLPVPVEHDAQGEHDDVQAEPPSITDVNEPPPPLSVADAQKRVVESQVRLKQAYERQREARGRVARALANWQRAIGEIRTHEDIAREFIATGLAERAAGGGRRPRSVPGPSVVDQMAHGHGRTVNVGRYGAWKRGGMSVTESQRRLNEAARAKLLPSEQ